MSIRPLLMYPHPALRRRSEPVIDWGKQADAVVKTATDLIDTMHDHEAAGLAAIQIGIPVRMLAIAQATGDPLVLINPEIVGQEGIPTHIEEGCLSFPDVWLRVLRYPRVTVRSYRYDGEEEVLVLDGIQAQGAQHEIEHLDGKLLIDHTSPLKHRLILQRMKKFRKHTIKTGHKISRG